jgi:hypothetical protein
MISRNREGFWLLKLDDTVAYGFANTEIKT